MKEKRRVRVAAGIVWKGERYLAACRPEGKIHSGFWEFPGGKQEPGESMEETLHRELEEELGIVCQCVTPWKVCAHAYPDFEVELHFMHVTAFSGEPLAKDGQELRWVTPREGGQLPFLEADIPVVRELFLLHEDV